LSCLRLPRFRAQGGFPEIELSVVGGTVDRVLGSELRPLGGREPLDLETKVERAGPSRLTLHLDPRTPAGTYLLICRLIPTGAAEVSPTVTITVL
jgi:hypothetical protein